jgi:hypothetical protein
VCVRERERERERERREKREERKEKERERERERECVCVRRNEKSQFIGMFSVVDVYLLGSKFLNNKRRNDI